MCWIFGYVWAKKASEEILNWLQKLEYRWYDSAGLCVINKKWDAKLIKSVGRIVSLRNKVQEYYLEDYTTWIGHTRWATHGKVTEINSHPHHSQNEKYFLVHNWIVENYSSLKKQLEEKWYKFYSQTDTEVAVKLFEDEMKLANDDKKLALKNMIHKMEWAYAIAIVDANNPDKIVWAKLGSPMVIWIAKDELYVSSDYRSLVWITKEYITLEDWDTFFIKWNKYEILNNGVQIVRDKDKITEKEMTVELGNFPNFMLKEIWEQKDVIKNVFAWKVDFEKKEILNNTLSGVATLGFEKVCIVASWTSYHSGLMGKYYFEEFASMEVEVNVSTEFKYKKKFVNDKTLYVFISQSWETADTLESLKLVNNQWGFTFWIVNVPGSSIARLSNSWLFTHAWTEVGVASTKAFVTQVTTLLIMSLYFWLKRWLSYTKYLEIIEALELIPEKIEKVLNNSKKIEKIAEKYSEYDDFFFLWRAHELPIAMEWSLKLKELTYKHSEAYSSWELKHGPIALIDEDFPTIVVNGNSPLYMKNISSLEEIKARKWKIISIVEEWDKNTDKYDDYIEFEWSIMELNPIIEVVCLQLFAYYMTLAIWNDVDKPRNLAKSVTVE